MGAFPAAIIMGFMNYINFEGFASRAEFWYWTLFRLLIGLAAGLFDGYVLNVGEDQNGPATLIITVLLFLPSLTVEVRRLRDAGYGWPSILWIFLPVIGWFILLYRLVQPTQHFSHSVYGHGN